MASTISHQYRDSDMQLFRSGQFSDVVVKCGDQTWRLHKNILASRSKWFEKVIRAQAGGPSSNLVTINKCPPGVTEVMLRYIYGGDPEDQTTPASLGEGGALLLYTRLHPAARFFGLPALANLCLDKIHIMLNQLTGQFRDGLPTAADKVTSVRVIINAIRTAYEFDGGVAKQFSEIPLLRAEFVHFVCDLWDILRWEKRFASFLTKEVPNFAKDVKRTLQRPLE